MTPNRLRAATAFDPHLTPPALAAWLSVFRSCFTAPVWNRVLVLVAGAVLAPGKRTVTQALRVMGLGEAPQFRRYHEVLGRARWDARAVARRLLLHLLERLLPNGPVVIGIDDTIERRWGARIKARGIYRDPVRSSKGHFVKTSGLRWLSLMVVVPISWSGRHWALPFLTVLAPSARWSEKHRKRHKTLTDWARQAILQTKRWLPDRWLIFVADSGFAALELLASVRCHVCVITRLRLDAALFKPAPRRRKGQRGRPPLKGRRLPTLRAVLASRKTVWTAVVVSQWYNAQQRKLLTATGTAVWYHAGIPPVPRAVQRSIYDTHSEDGTDAAKGDAMASVCDIVNAIEAQDVGGERAQACKDAGIASDAAGVFCEATVADVVRAVLDAPVVADGLGALSGRQHDVTDEQCGFAG
jgi:hypothetical protein